MFKSLARRVVILNHQPNDTALTGVLPALLRLKPVQDASHRLLSLSTRKCVDGKKKGQSKNMAQHSDNGKGMEVTPEVEKAAVEAAKSMPGDWTKTAEELLARLKMKDTSDAAVPTDGSSSLLSQMKVGRSFEGDKSERRKGRRKGFATMEDDLMFSRSETRQVSDKKFDYPRGGRRAPVFKQLYGAKRLGIFPEKKPGEVAPPAPKQDLWNEVNRERLRQLQGGIPRNAFEEMIKLTEEGKMWTFPIDNEADLHEERQYKFHQHVFLDRHLSAHPGPGPVRKFLELVTLGLGQNPWLTVPEKEQHLQWFSQYFSDKQAQITDI